MTHYRTPDNPVDGDTARANRAAWELALCEVDDETRLVILAMQRDIAAYLSGLVIDGHSMGRDYALKTAAEVVAALVNKRKFAPLLARVPKKGT